MGKTIIVTGASRGLGWAIAECLLTAPQPCNVVAVARNGGPLQELKNKYGNLVEILPGDATDTPTAREAVALALKSYGRLDGLILNHGVLEPVTRLEQTDVEQWKKAYDVNLFSLVEFVKQAIPHLRLARGKVIFISSGSSVGPVTAWGMYGSSKAAMNHLNMTLAHEEPEITSISIRPGMVDTKMQEELRSQHVNALGPKDSVRFISAHAEGRLLDPELPGGVIAKLAANAPIELSGKFISWNDPTVSSVAKQDKNIHPHLNINQQSTTTVAIIDLRAKTLNFTYFFFITLFCSQTLDMSDREFGGKSLLPYRDISQSNFQTQAVMISPSQKLPFKKLSQKFYLPHRDRPNEISEKEAKKTIACEHIEKALNDLGFGDYVPDVLAIAEEHKEQLKTREKRINKIDQSGMSHEELLRLQQELFRSAGEKYNSGS
ncbi:hypothetical protein FQN57_002332 [Myotisia sp. PD_48]|nr:hypothetical protein FQN57_002332 [Myotisia sp. PD_48]